MALFARTALLTALLTPILMAPAEPVPPVPSAAQVAWQQMEINAFVHFGPNTFTSAEWGTGREDPAVFNPTAFDARQWVRTFKDAGVKGVIITAKHHDGFCLWPSAQSTHTVAKSPWRGGAGDVLEELSAACREAGLRFGVYLSPWDRNHPAYGTPQYNQVFAAMLEEVLGRYGPVFEVWFDGANGEGPNGKKQVYDWPLFVGTVRRLQPQAVIFSDAGPDVRWVGNERGEGGTTSWSLIERARYVPGTDLSAELTAGFRNGPDWLPPECDVSIRPGWFYRSSEDAKVKTGQDLAELYERSVGRNCQLLLNVPPDRRGLLAAPDQDALAGMHRILTSVYGRNLLADASAGGASTDAAALTDGRLDTYWSPPDASSTGEVVLSLRRPITFDRIVLQEPIQLGQRVASFRLDAWADGTWKPIGEGTTVGYKRILAVPLTRTGKLRIALLDARAKPLLAEVGAYRTIPVS
jgi:alpha-L-fucosidase